MDSRFDSAQGRRGRLSPHECLHGVSWSYMKKQASDQSFHDRRHQERKRAEAAKKLPKKKVAAGAGKTDGESRAPSTE
jgi:hypothetical protein